VHILKLSHWLLLMLSILSLTACDKDKTFDPYLSTSDSSITEGNTGTKNLVFTVALSLEMFIDVEVDYATSNGSATTENNDYNITSGTLSFAPGETSKTINVPVHGDLAIESNETMTLVLSRPVNVRIEKGSATGTIIDDDFPSADEQNGAGGSGRALTNNLNADVLLFQANYTDETPNRGMGSGIVVQNGMNFPETMVAFVDPNDGNKLKMLMIEWQNARVHIFNSLPTDNTAVADVIVGQPDFTTGGANSFGISAASLHLLNGAAVCSTGELIVADRFNHRVLIFNQVPQENGASADVVIGQTDFTSNLANQGGSAASNTISSPQGVSCRDGKLYISDSNNHRILIFNTIPLINNVGADIVIGQADFTSTASSCSSSGVNTPHQLTFHDSKMYLSDQNNHRILIYDPVPTTHNPAASTVIGQANFTNCSVNQGSTVNANNLNTPQSFSISSDNILGIADRHNHRVVFYTLPITTGDSAFSVLGQTDMTSSLNPSPPTASSLNQPIGLLFQGNRIWVSDQQNHRWLAKPLPF